MKRKNCDRQTDISLLLTGTIDSSAYNDVGNLIQDVSIRLEQYETSIERYIKESPFNIIVFIENSGYIFDEEKYKRMAKKYGKKFEFIQGKICAKEIIEHGKSFGDAYLISEALDKSFLLKEVKFFYKISGRIFLENSAEICKTKNRYKNEFIVYQGKGWCFSNIFKANKDDYLMVLKDAYLECDERTGKDIERVFYNRLYKSNVQVNSFHVYPFFDGVMRATGKNYSGGICERIIRNIMARCHFFMMDSFTSKIFAKIFK